MKTDNYFVCSDGTFAETPALAAEREMRITFVSQLIATKDTFLAGAAERIADFLIAERDEIAKQFKQADDFVSQYPPLPIPAGAPKPLRRVAPAQPKIAPKPQAPSAFVPAAPAAPKPADFDIDALDRDLNAEVKK